MSTVLSLPQTRWIDFCIDPYDVIPVNSWFQGLIPGYFQNTPHPPTPPPDRDFGKSLFWVQIFLLPPFGRQKPVLYASYTPPQLQVLTFMNAKPCFWIICVVISLPHNSDKLFRPGQDLTLPPKALFLKMFEVMKYRSANWLGSVASVPRCMQTYWNQTIEHCQSRVE